MALEKVAKSAMSPLSMPLPSSAMLHRKDRSGELLGASDCGSWVIADQMNVSPLLSEQKCTSISRFDWFLHAGGANRIRFRSKQSKQARGALLLRGHDAVVRELGQRVRQRVDRPHLDLDLRILACQGNNAKINDSRSLVTVALRLRTGVPLS